MRHTLLLTGFIIGGLALPALADWDIGDPNTKWQQLPQLVGGYDVLSMVGTYPTSALSVDQIVADDWLCNDPRPVTDIHVWGSWWMDSEPAPGTWSESFVLTIYSDIPAVPGVSYSRPGSPLWSTIKQPTNRLVTQPGDEQFYDPGGVEPISPETEVWQHNFLLDPVEYFDQQPGTTYWLSVQALGPPNLHAWGWKTSADHWNDDAAWADAVQLDWQELTDPAGGLSLDMAFVLTVPEPQTYALTVGLALVGFAVWRRRRA